MRQRARIRSIHSIRKLHMRTRSSKMQRWASFLIREKQKNKKKQENKKNAAKPAQAHILYLISVGSALGGMATAGVRGCEVFANFGLSLGFLVGFLGPWPPSYDLMF
jgi:hypothetical protein